MTTRPPGGPSTIAGIYLQMLWCLLRASKITVEGPDTDSTASHGESATLILEPIGGGGDVQEITRHSRRIIQIKTRSGGGTWSLQEIIEVVLPDLYKAVDLDSPDSEYCFLTDGRIGRWEDVHTQLFEALRNKPCSDNPLDQLDDQNEVAFGRHENSAFWESTKYTQRTLFEKIVRHLVDIGERQRRVENPGSMLVDDDALKKVWRLLSRFRFVSGMNEDFMKREIDAILLQQINHREDVAKTRDAMIGRLADRAKHGNAEIVAKEFFAEFGLESIPLGDQASLLDRSRELFRRKLNLLGYNPVEDVRADQAALTVQGWSSDRPMLAFTGESGQGKSWALFAAGEYLTKQGEVIVLVEASGDAQRDLEDAADQFWQEIKGNDQRLSLSRIAERIRTINGGIARPWITLLIDGVQDPEEAKRLSVFSWEAIGARLALTCSEHISAHIEQLSRGKCQTVPITDFSLRELQQCLAITVGEHWPQIPPDVRNTLRRPILASIYNKLHHGEHWHPPNEYALYRDFWLAIGSRAAPGVQFDGHRLGQLAVTLLDMAPYPWTIQQLSGAQFNEECLARLMRCGWLRCTADQRYEVVHDRLLNWAVAEGLMEQFRSGQLAVDSLASKLLDLLKTHKTLHGKSLGYVPLDVIYLLLAEGQQGHTFVAQFLKICESDDYRTAETLYTHLLPTLGSTIVPILFQRIGELADADDIMCLGKAINAAIRFPTAEVVHHALELLSTHSPPHHRAAMRVLKRCPSADAIPRLWELHCGIERDPTHYLKGNESKFFVYEEAIAALRACVRLDPAWLEKTIAVADPVETPVHDLAYLVASMNDGGKLWRSCKQTLIEKVPESKARSIATNISVYRDRDEVSWLLKRIDKTEDSTGPAAFRALVNIDPILAAKQIHRFPKDELAPTRHWWLGGLIANAPDAVRAELQDMMMSSDDPWRIAEVYHDYENDLDAVTLEFLLGTLEPLLDDNAKSINPKDGHRLYRPLNLLSRVSRYELLECFEAHRNLALYQKLVDYLLRIGPHEGYWQDCLERKPAMIVLQKIGGAGLSTVINSYLSRGSKPGRLDVIKDSVRNPNSDTIHLLKEISQQDERWDGHAVEQGYATKCLATLGEGRAVVESMLRWGTDTLLDVDELYSGQRPINDEDIDPAIDVLSRNVSDRVPGAIMAIGFGRRHDLIGRILATFDRSEDTSKVALASLLAFRDLRLDSDDIVVFILKQLAIPNHKYAARQALLAIGTQESLATLCRHLETDHDDRFTLALLGKPGVNSQASELLRSRITNPSTMSAQETLRYLLHFYADESIRALLVSLPHLEEHFREAAFAAEGSFWLMGSKVNAIRGLSMFDVQSATVAARYALRDTSARDREQYPYLLMELDPDEAVRILLDQSLVEKSYVVRAAIGRALSCQPVTDTLADWTASGDPKKELVACAIARWQSPSTILNDVIKTCVESCNNKTSIAALQTLRSWRQTDTARRLLGALVTEADQARKWMLLDALIDTADPGDAHQPWPLWASEVSGVLSPYMQSYLGERLQERRKKTKEDLERDTSRSDD